MKTYNSMYLGLCVNNNDPEKRGRVQVYVPHIMPALEHGWTNPDEDISFSGVGDNIANSIPSNLLAKLQQILPWAEAASPVIGTSSPGNLVSNTARGAALGLATGGVSGAVAGAAIAAASSYFDQSPTTGVVAYTGSSGIGTGPHLDVRWADGRPITAEEADRYLVVGGQSPSSYGVTSKYGPRSAPVAGASTFHKGIDFGIPSGTPVTLKGGATYLENRGYLGKAGNVLEIQTPEGVMKLLHLSEVLDATSLSAQTAAAANVHQAPEGSPTVSLSGQAADPTLRAINVLENGTVDQEQLRSYLTAAISRSKLNGYNPLDGSEYGVDGSVDSWVNHFMSLAKNESSYFYQTKNLNDPGGSYGLFQISPLDGSRYGANPSGQNWSMTEVYDPVNNANTAIAIYERNVLRDGYIVNLESGKGAGGYYASTTMNRIQKEAASGTIGNYDSSAPVSRTALVANTSSAGPISINNINDMAKGLFSFPAAGSMLWVFFREGNPLYPVYFATSYSAAEWKSAYRGASPGPGYNPVSENGEPTSTGGTMNLNGVGGFRWENTTDYANGSEDKKSIMFFGEDGSNMLFADGVHQIYSRFNRRNQVDGDQHDTVLGFKETWIQGDDNKVVMGDKIVKIGNISQKAVDAVNELLALNKEIQAPLLEENPT